MNGWVHSRCRQNCCGSGLLGCDIHCRGLVGSGFLRNIGQCLIRSDSICFGLHGGGLDWRGPVHQSWGQCCYIIEQQFEEIGYLHSCGCKVGCGPKGGRSRHVN
uniref:Uncharacterized protein n=1 Tax=Romanomermis culicivorax TaxID=13658 RepID=A0A915KLY3_ROMCU